MSTTGVNNKGSDSANGQFPVTSSAVEQAAHEAAVADGLITPNGSALTKAEENKAKKAGLRRGKWTTEEEYYANRLIYEFKLGLLPLTDGTTLRTFLSKLLNCDPMRISKKFVGQNCIGKQVFRRRQTDLEKLTKEQIEMSRKELAELERKFLERVAQTNRTKSSGGGVKSMKDGKMDYEDENGNTILAPWMIPPDEASAASSTNRSVGASTTGGSVGGNSASKSGGNVMNLSNSGMNVPPGMDPAIQQQFMMQQRGAGFPALQPGQQQPFPYMQHNAQHMPPMFFNDPRVLAGMQGNSSRVANQQQSSGQQQQGPPSSSGQQSSAPNYEANSMAAMEFQQQLYHQYMMMAGGNPNAAAAAAAAAAATFTQHQQAAAAAAASHSGNGTNASSNSSSNMPPGLMPYPPFMSQQYNMYQQQFQQQDQHMNFNNSNGGGEYNANANSAGRNNSDSGVNGNNSMQRVSSYDILSSIAQLNSTQSLDNLQNLGWSSGGNNESSTGDKSSINGNNNSSGANGMSFNASMGTLGESLGWTASLSQFDNISNMNLADGMYGSKSQQQQSSNGLVGLMAQSGSTVRQATLPYTLSKAEDIGYDLDENHGSPGDSGVKAEHAVPAKDDKKKRKKSSSSNALSASQQFVRPPIVDMNTAMNMGAYSTIPADSMAMMAHMYQSSGDSNANTSSASKSAVVSKKSKSNSSGSTPTARQSKDSKDAASKGNETTTMENSKEGQGLTKNGSIDDFWMLVNMGDLPQPEQDVLSNIVWPGKNKGAPNPATVGQMKGNAGVGNRGPPYPPQMTMNADMQAQMHAQMQAQMQMLQQQHMQQSRNSNQKREASGDRLSSSTQQLSKRIKMEK